MKSISRVRWASCRVLQVFIDTKKRSAFIFTRPKRTVEGPAIALANNLSHRLHRHAGSAAIQTLRLSATRSERCLSQRSQLWNGGRDPRHQAYGRISTLWLAITAHLGRRRVSPIGYQCDRTTFGAIQRSFLKRPWRQRP